MYCCFAWLENEADQFYRRATFNKTSFQFTPARTAWYDLTAASTDYDFFVIIQEAIDLADGGALHGGKANAPLAKMAR
ncbi:MAG: hypothetical protein HKP25_07910 [Marinicaulis sp.]|nr:hypothetical protein [Marinicaulis sp.]